MSSFKRSIYKRLLPFVDRPAIPLTPQQKTYLNELKEEIAALHQDHSNDPHNKWTEFSLTLVNSLKNDAVESFLRWSVITKTMFVSNPYYLKAELKFLKSLGEKKPKFSRCLVEDAFGHPLPYLYQPNSSGNRIHHSYHLAMYEQATGKDIGSFGLVLEFGGGYGSMCRIFHKLGFQGKYVIFDLPAFSALQKFYLRSLDVPVLPIEKFSSVETGVFLVSSLQELRTLLDDVDFKQGLFLATWSLSEAPLSLREGFEDTLSSFDSNLIAFQHRFEEIDNLAYFSHLQSRRTNLNWRIFEIPSFKSGHSYLFS